MVDKCIKEFTVPEKDLVIALPYLSKIFLQRCTKIYHIMKSKFPDCNLHYVVHTKGIPVCFPRRITSFLHSDIVHKFHCGNYNTSYHVIVYKFHCGDYNTTYHDKTKCHFKIRMCEHLQNLALAIKRVISNEDSAVTEHLLF